MISKLDQIKTIKEDAIAKMDFEKALKAKEAIQILESIGENLNNIFKVKLKYIREDNREQAEYYTNAYNMVQSTLLKYEFEYDAEQMKYLRDIDRNADIAAKQKKVEKQWKKENGKPPKREHDILDNAQLLEWSDDLELPGNTVILHPERKDADIMVFGVKREVDAFNKGLKRREGEVGAPLGMQRMGSGLMEDPYGESPKAHGIYPQDYDPMEAPLRGERNLEDEYDEDGVYEYDEAPEIDITTLNQLDPKDRVVAESLVRVLGADLLLKIYNRTWGTRVAGFSELNKGLKSNNFSKMDRDQIQDVFIAVLSIINKGLTDKVAQVNTEAVLTYLTAITNTFKSVTQIDSKQSKYEFGVQINQIIDNLMLKTAD